MTRFSPSQVPANAASSSALAAESAATNDAALTWIWNQTCNTDHSICTRQILRSPSEIFSSVSNKSYRIWVWRSFNFAPFVRPFLWKFYLSQQKLEDQEWSKTVTSGGMSGSSKPISFHSGSTTIELFSSNSYLAAPTSKPPSTPKIEAWWISTFLLIKTASDRQLLTTQQLWRKIGKWLTNSHFRGLFLVIIFSFRKLQYTRNNSFVENTLGNSSSWSHEKTNQNHFLSLITYLFLYSLDMQVDCVSSFSVVPFNLLLAQSKEGVHAHIQASFVFLQILQKGTCRIQAHWQGFGHSVSG